MPDLCLTPGNDLPSQEASLPVFSALEVFTSVFGMGTGVAPPLGSPGLLRSMLARRASAFGLQISSLACRFASVLHRRRLGCESLPRGPTLAIHFASGLWSLPSCIGSRAGEALDRFVSVRSTHHCASTPDRSTSSSSRGLTSFSEWDTSS